MKSNIRTLYEKIADTWKSKVWVQSPDFNHKIACFAGLKGNENALDVGIGSGELESFLELKNVTGMDISKKMIDKCKNNHPTFKLLIGDAEKIPFKDNSFDFVFCRNLLQHFDNPHAAFCEMHRVTKKDGKIMVVESAVYEPERKYVTEIVRVAEPYHPLFPSHEQLRSLFEGLNMKNIEQHVGGLHKKWLAAWCDSKQAGEEQREKILHICEMLPGWYKKKYHLKMHKSEKEVESTLTFSFLKGHKQT